MDNPESNPDRYALVGHPVHHSRSPLIHQLFAQQTEEQVSYELIDADEEHFEAAVRDFKAAGGKGLNVTVPHKQRAFRLADELGEEASRAKAVNTLSFRNGIIRGDNTDGIGFMRDLTLNLEREVQGRRVMILGAGGAARGILGPLLDADPAELWLANRTLERAETLKQELTELTDINLCEFDELGDLRPFDIVINATSAGLKGEALPFPGQLVGADSFCYDLTYSLKETPFVNWALSNGAELAVQGWGMLVEQAAASYLIWRGRRPDTAPILEQMIR